MLLCATSCSMTININTPAKEEEETVEEEVVEEVTPADETTQKESVNKANPTEQVYCGFWVAEAPEYESIYQLTLNADGTCALDTLTGVINSSGNMELAEGDAFWFDKGTYTVKSQSSNKTEMLCTLKSEYDMSDGPPEEPYKLLFSFEKVTDDQLIATMSDEDSSNPSTLYFFRCKRLDDGLFQIIDPDWRPATASNPQPIPDVTGEEFTGYTGVHYCIPDGFIDVPGQLGNTGKEDVATYMYCNPDLDMTIGVLIEGNEYDDVYSAMREEYDQESSINDVTYSVFKENFYVVSGLEDGRVYYNKAIYEHSDYLYYLFFEYPKENKNPCDGILEEFVKSFEVIR